MLVLPDGEEGLVRFVTESNLIERITRSPTDAEVLATYVFVHLDKVNVADLSNLVEIFSPGHVLRARTGLNISVGDYVPPPGGPSIVEHLTGILKEVNQNLSSPWRAHVRYERLHPYTDGNGRTGRALWAWHMRHLGRDPFVRTFLHEFYYQTLEHLP